MSAPGPDSGPPRRRPAPRAAAAEGAPAKPASTLRKIHSVPSYQQVYDVIEAEILGRRLSPGDLLPTEAVLADTLGVNRSTVREGIRLLQQTGLVRRAAGRRLVVSRPRSAEMSSSLGRAMIMHQVTFHELWEVLLVLEPLAAGFAAGRATKAELRAIELNVVATEQAAAAGRPLMGLDAEFHSMIAATTRNRALSLAREPIGHLLYPASARMMVLVPQSAERLAQAHRRILDAIKLRDVAVAEQWMRRHITDFQRGYEVAGLDTDQPVGQPA